MARQKLECRFGSYVEYERVFDYRQAKPKVAPGGYQRIYRRFVGKDGRGGRLFGDWVQQLPRDLRRDRLTINGQPTCELDYGSMQLVLLYVLADAPVPAAPDLYQMLGMGQHREDMKMVLTLSVGNATRSETVSAIGGRLREQNRAGKGKAAGLYDAFWHHHAPANPHRDGITEPAWPQLQNLESRIALRVLALLLDRKITAIPIHDSFVVQARHRDCLGAAMQDAFAALCPRRLIRIR
ncbi:hypothetical protein [Citreimonas salinaria]|uniref:Uncharacterized protein n=1 Tax=Citreimonas salinaria TaxID=321339 RepID=A0A1H3NXZ4_9RHOB|nr:hypothetical protein [Citreimonas salinaria]SDY93766.1 hypothetical protein SAMN05444340_13710 [Citreimonas salinaria]